MSLAYLTRRVTFSAAHRYWRDDWPEAQNREVFGACANPHGHGHNYALEATVEGEVDAETGFVIDLVALDRVLRDAIVVPLDHQHVNHAVPDFGAGGLVPSTENLAAWAWTRIARHLPPGVRLHRVRLRENDDLYVDFFGGTEGVVP
jgi:6-pyruvoyltetrahydropterin/6-carboxytetrahydropterin synthase